MVGMFVCLCLVSKKPSEREFFVPAGMDLCVKLLMAMGLGGNKNPGTRTFLGRHVPMAGTQFG
jgi:hypothetical protein